MNRKTHTPYIHKCMPIMLKTVSTLSFSSKKMEEKAGCWLTSCSFIALHNQNNHYFYPWLQSFLWPCSTNPSSGVGGVSFFLLLSTPGFGCMCVHIRVYVCFSKGWMCWLYQNEILTTKNCIEITTWTQHEKPKMSADYKSQYTHKCRKKKKVS